MTSQQRRLTDRKSAGPQAGLTLVELMITLTIGLIIIGALGMLFIGSSSTRREVETTAETIENGRYAIDLLSRELSLAGYYGTLTRPAGGSSTGIPCSTSPADWTGSLELHTFGWNQDAGDPACLTDRKAGTDAIFIQRASTCEAGIDGCEGERADRAYIQVSECGETYNTDPPQLGPGRGGDGVTGDGGTDAEDEATGPAFDLKTSTCDGDFAPLRRFVRGIYFVNSNDVLSYREIGPSGSRTVELVENVEQLQFSYAVDTDPEPLGASPEKFTAKPTAAEWPNVIGVRVWILARSPTESDRPEGTPSFQLDDMPADAVDVTKAYRRRVSTTYISFVSPTLRRAK
jgi:type IV pilus assembly protein PilW